MNLAQGPARVIGCSYNPMYTYAIHWPITENSQMKRVLFAIAAAAIVGGCASADVNTPEKQYVDRDYRTGSNIAVRRAAPADGVTTMSAEDVENARNSSLNSGAQMPPPRPGSH
jgi:hypothetical protein